MKTIVTFLLITLGTFAHANDKNGYSLPNLSGSDGCFVIYSAIPLLSCVGQGQTLTYDSVPLLPINKDLNVGKNPGATAYLSLIVQMNRWGFDLVGSREPAGVLYFIRRTK